MWKAGAAGHFRYRYPGKPEPLVPGIENFVVEQRNTEQVLRPGEPRVRLEAGVQPAAEIVREINEGARAILRRLAE